MRERAELSRVPMSNLFRLNRGGGVFSLLRKFHQGLGAISFHSRLYFLLFPVPVLDFTGPTGVSA